MNCCLQNHTTYQFTYFLFYLFHDKFKNSRIIKIYQVHEKLQTKQYIILFTLFLIYISVEFKVEIGFSGEPMTQYTHESCAKVNHMRKYSS